MSLIIHPITTRIFRCGEDLATFVSESVPRERVRNRMILAITSKIVSLAERRVVKRQTVDKKDLVRQEADAYLGEINYGYALTIKHGLLIPSAGIDESNSENGDYILYPADPFASAEDLWRRLRQAWGLHELGILITDSHVAPLRRGVTGVCLSYWGFGGLTNLIGTRDLFDRPLTVTQMNLADGLASATVMMMGEGAESRPLATVEGAPVQFAPRVSPGELSISIDDDLFSPLLKSRIERERAP